MIESDVRISVYKMKKLLLAISKGRILEEALKILKNSGVECKESPFQSRKLIFETNYKNLNIIIVRASDVPIILSQESRFWNCWQGYIARN